MVKKNYKMYRTCRTYKEKYMHWSSDIADYINREIASKRLSSYYDLFCGDMAVSSRVSSGSRHCWDIDGELISLWKALQAGDIDSTTSLINSINSSNILNALSTFYGDVSDRLHANSEIIDASEILDYYIKHASSVHIDNIGVSKGIGAAHLRGIDFLAIDYNDIDMSSINNSFVLLHPPYPRRSVLNETFSYTKLLGRAAELLSRGNEVVLLSRNDGMVHALRLDKVMDMEERRLTYGASSLPVLFRIGGNVADGLDDYCDVVEF